MREDSNALPPALPVHLAVDGADADAVRDWIEGVLGWQRSEVDGDDPVPPLLCIRDLTAAGVERPAGVAPELPTILLVGDDTPPAGAAAAAGQLRPAAVLGWPSQRDALPEVASAVLSRRTEPDPGAGSVLRVGGSAGGVGTTTVALALGGLKAWRGDTTLVAVRGYGLDWCPVQTAALGGNDLWAAADVLPGFDGVLRAVRIVDAEPAPAPRDPAVAALVLDLGPDADADVLVCRADGAGLDAMEATAAAAVVVVGGGPLPRAAVDRAAQGRRLVTLPHSARVARAGLQGRVPAGLPGSFVARLAPLLGSGARGPSRGPGLPPGPR